MNIYFILFGFIILYMFKSSCVVEGVDDTICPRGCVNMTSYDLLSEDCAEQSEDAERKIKELTLRASDRQNELANFLEARGCPPPPSCP